MIISRADMFRMRNFQTNIVGKIKTQSDVQSRTGHWLRYGAHVFHDRYLRLQTET